MSERKKSGLLAIVSALVFILAASGCGPSTTGTLKVTPVKGTVKLKGAPLADADLGFVPMGETAKDFTSAGAKTDAQGNFEVTTGTQKGLPAGNYKVTVSKLVGKDGQPVVPTEGMDIAQYVASGEAKNAVPDNYADHALSPVEVEVIDGTPKEVTIDIP